MKEITEDKGRIRPVIEGEFQCDQEGNSTIEYEVLSIVSIKNEDYITSYISKKAVPKGIPITDEEYWHKFDVDASPTLYTEITYNELAALKNNNALFPGRWYRIIDYMTTTFHEWTTVADTHFDILVQAITNNQFDENAKAISKNGDTYFSNNGVDPSNWTIKYNFEGHTVTKILKINNYYYFIKDNHICSMRKQDAGLNITTSSLKDIILAFNVNDEDYISIGVDTQYDTIDSEGIVTSGSLLQVGESINPYVVYENRGTITYMEDELNNIAYYDFKTILFARFKAKNNTIAYANDFVGDGDYYYQSKAAAENISNIMGDGDVIVPNGQSLPYWFCENHAYYKIKKGNNLDYSSYINAKNENVFTINPDSWYKMMSNVCDNDDGIIVEVDNTPYYFYTFSRVTASGSGASSIFTITDESLSNYNVHDNIINVYCGNTKTHIRPNNTVFMGYNSQLVCYCNSIGFNNNNNTFGNMIKYNTFGNNTKNNTFGNNTQNNIFGNTNVRNFFGSALQDNTFGNNTQSNTFEETVLDNTFGNNITCNTFGRTIQSNTFGNNIRYNTFGGGIYYNTFGNSIKANTFGKYISYNTFGNNIEALIINQIQDSYFLEGTIGEDYVNRIDLSNVTGTYANRSIIGYNSKTEEFVIKSIDSALLS